MSFIFSSYRSSVSSLEQSFFIKAYNYRLTKYISWYILKTGGYMQTARLFVNGRSQAVRLPKEYQFKGENVYIQKVGEAVILVPFDKAWQTFLHGLNLNSEMKTVYTKRKTR